MGPGWQVDGLKQQLSLREHAAAAAEQLEVTVQKAEDARKQAWPSLQLCWGAAKGHAQ